jgi:serine phosphatase RsbU (regulator of sigma subunit)
MDNDYVQPLSPRHTADSAAAKKLRAAEKHIALLRVLFTGFCGVVYLLFMRSDPALVDYQLLAWLIITGGSLYSLFVFMEVGFATSKLMSNRLLSIMADGTVTALWIVATGWMDSPFYLVWYLSIITIAARYTARETSIAAAVYLALYAGIYFLDEHSQIETHVLITRMGFIPLAGFLGMYFSNEIAEQIADKLRISQAEAELKQAHDELEERVKQRTAELQVMHDDITDSINYANRIQNAILPDGTELRNCFANSCVVYLPKDIISGDFYWSHRRGNLVFLAVVDCTGHGVPGALMSMIGNNLLNQVIVEHHVTSPDIILQKIDLELERLLTRGRMSTTINDGMDMSVCMVDRDTNTVSFAGAQQSGLFFHAGEHSILESTKLTIGGLSTGSTKQFKLTSMNYVAGDRVYLLSDGFQDQFGGSRGKKYFRKNLLTRIIELQNRPIDEHGLVLTEEFLDWKGDEMQMDDVTIVGIEL